MLLINFVFRFVRHLSLIMKQKYSKLTLFLLYTKAIKTELLYIITLLFFQAFTIIFPRFDPVNNPMNASGIFSNPSMIVSSYFIFPS